MPFKTAATPDIIGLMEKILLFYKFTPVKDPDVLKLWQKTLCESLALKGRILISKHGINGTVGGELESLKKYIKETKQFPGFKGTEFKWSDGSKDDFPKLQVKVRPELVAFGVPDEVKVDDNGVIGAGKHLKPNELHELMKKRGKEVVFFDGRNAYEAEIGRFKNAVVPDTRTTKDFIRELDSNKYDDIKDKPVVTYCTGGIRCEILSSLMKKRGFKDIYQMDGGIVKYGEAYADEGYWEGSLYVFDKRMNLEFSDKAKKIGVCIRCGKNTSNFENCAYKPCNNLVLMCEKCHKQSDTCSAECAEKNSVLAAA
jgi:UPF0176 protein